jgi:RNA polymerase sigma-70 factor (ECF subfamily)
MISTGSLARWVIHRLGCLIWDFLMTGGTRNEGQTDPTQWLDAHGDALFRYALLRLRDSQQAEDVVQDTLLAALRSRDRFSGKSSERTWLVGILKHKIVDRVRENQRAAVTTDTDAPESWTAEHFDRRGVWHHKPKSWGRAPEADLEQKEFWTVFHRCMSELPQRLAKAFFLRDVDHLNSDEVCDVMGISATNLWTILHRARLHLRRCLEVRWFGGKKQT